VIPQPPVIAGAPDWVALLGQARDLMLPEVILTLFACLALVLDVLLPRRMHRWAAYASLGGVALALASLVGQYTAGRGAFPRYGFFNMLVVDEFSILMRGVFLLAVGLSIAVAVRYLDEEDEQRGEYYALMLFATVGMMFMAGGADLLSLYIALELMAVSVYVLVGYLKRSRESNEASMKYFLLGAFSSGVLLYGMSLVYGATGSTNLQEIAARLPGVLLPGSANDLRYLLVAAAVTLTAGLLFKVAAVPFHMWAPDAYEGAPTPVTAFMSVGVKAASFAMFARLFLTGVPDLRSVGDLPGWGVMLGVVAAVTMTWGNFAAVTQRNAKRLLAYSSISQAGYLLLGILAGNRIGYIGLVVYLVVYVFMNLGAFAVLITLRRGAIEGDRVEDFDGLAERAPGMAALMTIFLLSLGGIPPTAGFIGKFYLFYGLFQSPDRWLMWLAAIAVVNTAVSAYYYLLFVRAMYAREPAAGAPAYATSPALWGAVAVAAAVTILVGLYPQPLVRMSNDAVEGFGEAPSAFSSRPAGERLAAPPFTPGAPPPAGRR
jgi:NADH-quinone oxidoreductase subunit N